MKLYMPRDQRKSNASEHMVDYGPTPISIRLCIRYVRDAINTGRCSVVFLTDIRKLYGKYVSEDGERTVSLKDNRSFKKYLQPSLAMTDIFWLA